MDATEIYHKGFVDGLTAYAHWKNGDQLVGTLGYKLKDAIAQAEDTWSWAPPSESELEPHNPYDHPVRLPIEPQLHGRPLPLNSGDMDPRPLEDSPWETSKRRGLEVPLSLTTDRHWDCECLGEAGPGRWSYIHPKGEPQCPVCGCRAEDSPDSHITEVQAAGLPLKSWKNVQ